MSRRTVTIIYWVSTSVFAALLGWSAVMYLTEAPKMMATMAHLGYPDYFIKGLGVAKLLGIAALFLGPPRLREWAYAGFTFDILGATVSHFASGDGLAESLVPLAFLALLAVSYVTERRRHALETTESTHGHRLSHAH